MPLVLTEYPDTNGQRVYFITPPAADALHAARPAHRRQTARALIDLPLGNNIMPTRRTFLMQSAASLAATAHLPVAQATKPALSGAKAPDKAGVMQPLDLARVTLGGEFGRRVERIIEANILKIDLDETFLADFRTRGKGGYVGLGKFIDSVVRLAAGTGDARLVALKKQLIAALLATREPDGYIGIIADPASRMRILWDVHENAYLIWALVSDHQFFGEASSLQVAQSLADYMLPKLAANPPRWSDIMDDSITPFSIASIGLDRALLALSCATGRKQYRDFVVDVLKLNEYDPEIRPNAYTLDNHAYTHMAHCLAQLDLYRETGNPQLLRATRRALAFMRKGDGMLVTGSCTDMECWHDTQSGLKSSSETCMAAYVARVMDAMLRLEGGSLYGDIMERDIYNALFAATAPDGSKSRYFTPFDGKRVYDTMGNRYCCANNNKRFLADLRGWMYYRKATGVVVNLYNASTATLSVAPDVALKIEQQTDYPTSGDVLLKIDPSAAARFEVCLRIPRWCKEATVAVNGATPQTVAGGQFHVVERTWNPGDTVQLKMPMEWRFIRGRRTQAGRVAVLRGPVIFTLNPERNAKVKEMPDFEPRLMAIDPLDVEPPARDDTLRPGGLSCTINSWPPGRPPWPIGERVSLVLTEYPDPDGRGIYFMIPGAALAVVADDELI